MKKLICISRKRRDDLLKAFDEILKAGRADREILKTITERNEDGIKCSFIFEDFEDLKEKIERVKQAEGKIIEDGIYFPGEKIEGKIAFLFPGQGSQKIGMFSIVKEKFSQMKESIEIADNVLREKLGKNLSDYIYPPSAGNPEEEKKQMEELTKTNITQPALAVVEMGLFKILRFFGILPDMSAGHSLGEYVALSASGFIEEDVLYQLLEARGRAIIEGGGEEGKMMAIGAGEKEVKELIGGYDIYISNLNSPSQTIVSGRIEELERLKEHLKEKKIRAKVINVSCAFHSPFMMKAKEIFDRYLKEIEFKKGTFPVYSNLTGEKYPEQPEKIREILSRHLVEEVRFIDEIENMYRDGARVFIEIGPGKVLTGLVNSTLAEKDFVAMTVDKSDQIEGLFSAIALSFIYSKNPVHFYYEI